VIFLFISIHPARSRFDGLRSCALGVATANPYFGGAFLPGSGLDHTEILASAIVLATTFPSGLMTALQ